MRKSFQEKNLRGTLIALILLAGISALAAGYSFMRDPSGATLGIPLWYLQDSGFSSYMIPGIILFVAIGVFGLLTAYALVWRWNKYPSVVFIYGCVLTGWIAVQIMLVRDFNLFHLLFLIMGLALIVSATQLSARIK